jgi:lipopolysaccharide biosynthesis protein
MQSFFLGFGAKALQSPAFTKFWRDVRPAPFKTFIIREYEIGLTQKMLKAGLRCRAIWPYDALVNQVASAQMLDELARAERLRLARTDPIMLNPSADLWRQLLLGGFPFIKRELLRKNPSHVEDIGDWVTVLRDELGLDPEPVLAELRGGLKNRAP